MPDIGNKGEFIVKKMIPNIYIHLQLEFQCGQVSVLDQDEVCVGHKSGHILFFLWKILVFSVVHLFNLSRHIWSCLFYTIHVS